MGNASPELPKRHESPLPPLSHATRPVHATKRYVNVRIDDRPLTIDTLKKRTSAGLRDRTPGGTTNTNNRAIAIVPTAPRL